jgi:hypothetical protein
LNGWLAATGERFSTRSCSETQATSSENSRTSSSTATLSAFMFLWDEIPPGIGAGNSSEYPKLDDIRWRFHYGGLAQFPMAA